MPEKAPPPSTFFPGLAGLRGIAAIWCVLFHMQLNEHFPVLRNGFLSVDMFFMLSGFVLSHSQRRYVHSFACYRQFLWARVARLFPLQWVSLLLLLAIVVLVPSIPGAMPHRFEPAGFVLSVLLMQNWGWSPPMLWNIPAWSLSAEWLVSLLFPLFFFAAARFRRAWTTGLALVACLALFVAFLAVTHNSDTGVVGRAGLVRTALEFLAGCLLYRLKCLDVRLPAAVAAVAAALLAIGCLSPAWSPVAVFAFPCLILMAAGTGRFARAMSYGPLLFLGDVSFSIYLLHWMILLVSERAMAALGLHGAGALAWSGAYLAFVIGLSAMSHRWVEVQGRRWMLALRLPGLPAADRPQPKRAAVSR